MKLKVLSIFGTRPDAVKMAPLVKALAKDSAFESLVCVTAQHRQMLDTVLKCFAIKPDWDLDIMKDRQSLPYISSAILEKLTPVLQECKPDLVLVHGDTSTSTMAALAAFYEKIPIGHVEAGLRSFDRYSPFPEEMNRCLTGRLATLHFAPTEESKNNLLKEGITENVFVTGNTAIDAMKYTVREDYRFDNPQLADLDLSQGKLIVMTAHRRENIGEPHENIFRAVRRLAESYKDLRILYAVHKNPEVLTRAEKMLGGVKGVILTEPLHVIDLHNLMARCTFVMTDSGGLQEEAPALGKPVLVLRTETERPEIIEQGAALLAGVDEESVFSTAKKLLDDQAFYQSLATRINPYGDGNASEKIIAGIKKCFS